jgi:hypothetical protein
LTILETLIVNEFWPHLVADDGRHSSPSTSYVLASLRALHVDLLLAGGKVGNDRGKAIRAQARVRWGTRRT